MYKKTEDLFEIVFTSKTKMIVLKNIQTGIYACNQFISDNKEFFNHINMCNSLHDLRNYSISRQFTIESQKGTSPYTVTTDELGAYKYKVSFLNFDGVIATVAKTRKADNLPSKSRYKIELSKRNNFEDIQISLLDEIKDLPPDYNAPNYCIFTYGLNGDKLTHCRIIIPDHEYKKCLKNISIMDSFEIIKSENDIVEENIPILKKELQQKFKING